MTVKQKRVRVRYLRWLGRLIAVLLAVLLAEQVGPPAPAIAQSPSGITSPVDNSVVRGQVQIIGTAVHPQFLRYELFFGPCPVSGAEWCGIGDAVFRQVQNGLLGVWNTTAIPDGTYSIQLRVVKQDGNYESYFVRGLTVANTQPPTATPTPTETPSTPTATPPGTVAGGTPTVIIQQPPTSTPRPPTATPRATAAAGATSGRGDSGGSLGGILPLPDMNTVNNYVAHIRAAFILGMWLGVGAILLLGIYLGLRNSVRAAFRRVRRGGWR